jgi:hypothetical protein
MILMYEHAKAKRTEMIKAYIFGFSLLAALCAFVISGITSSGPIILGSEMNANGTTEYMCLGNGCDTYTAFQWSDK